MLALGWEQPPVAALKVFTGLARTFRVRIWHLWLDHLDLEAGGRSDLDADASA